MKSLKIETLLSVTTTSLITLNDLEDPKEADVWDKKRKVIGKLVMSRQFIQDFSSLCTEGIVLFRAVIATSDFILKSCFL